MRLALAAALAVVLALPAPHGAAAKKAGADAIPLRFAWPESG